MSPSLYELAQDSIFSFHCTVCGKCCDSPPQLSLAELFRFQDVFVGCLAVTRAASPVGIAVRVQGYGYDDLPCPALHDGKSCALHESGKPAMCRAVPLDPLLPDDAQAAVLARRAREAAFMAADCIRRGQAETHAPLLRGARVTDAAMAASLAEHRAAALADHNLWGRAVLEMLCQGQPGTAAMARLVPARGFLALPLVPVLQILAGISDSWRARCGVLVGVQVALIDTTVRRAIARGRASDRPMTRRLRDWAVLYRDFSTALAGEQMPCTA